MFQTEPDWEISAGMGILRALAGEAGLRQFRMFELALNMPIYRLDVVLPEKYSKDQVLRRFRLQSLTDALQFIREYHPVEIRLSQETAFQDGAQDEVRNIESVSTARTESNEEVLVCESASGRFHVGIHGGEFEGPVTDLRKIWPRQSSMIARLF